MKIPEQQESIMFTFRKQSILLCLILGIMCFFQSQSQAQVAITAVPFLQINNDARSMGMAGSNVAMRGARSGIHLNPAAFGDPNTLKLTTQFNLGQSNSFFGTNWLPSFGVRNNDIAIYTPQFIIGFEKLSLAYQYTRLNLGSQAVTDPDSPAVIDRFDSYERAHTFSAAYQVLPYFSVGAGINFIKSSLGGGQTINGTKIYDATQTSWDLGLLADYPFETKLLKITPSLGWSLTDIGNPISYTASTKPDPLPIMMRGGLGLKITYKDDDTGTNLFSWAGYLSRAKIMARCDENRECMGPWDAIFNSWGPYQRFTGTEMITLSLRDQLMRQHGMEIMMLDIFSFRFGRFSEHKYNGDRHFNTYGVGISHTYFSLDFAKINTDERDHPLENTSFFQFTAKVPFDDIEHWFN